MNKVFRLGEFNEENLDEFISFVNKYPDDKWNIIVNCSGGSNWIYDQFLYLLNLNKDKTTLIIGEISSNGFCLFLNFKGEIILTSSANGMYHLSCTYPSILVNGKNKVSAKSNYEIVSNREMKHIYNSQIMECKKFMTEKELTELKKGHDMYYAYTDLKRILKKIKSL